MSNVPSAQPSPPGNRVLFLSYASEDEEFVQQVMFHLDRPECVYFYPADHTLGDRLDEHLKSAIYRSHRVIGFFSKHYFSPRRRKSTWMEAAEAADVHKLIPVRIDDHRYDEEAIAPQLDELPEGASESFAEFHKYRPYIRPSLSGYPPEERAQRLAEILRDIIDKDPVISDKELLKDALARLPSSAEMPDIIEQHRFFNRLLTMVENGRQSMLVLHGDGGMGKTTTLVRLMKALHRFPLAGHGEANWAVVAYSFYHQGADAIASPDLMFTSLLEQMVTLREKGKHFQSNSAAAELDTPQEHWRGSAQWLSSRILKMMAAQPTLVCIDGLEPVLGATLPHKFIHRELEEFFEKLAEMRRGLTLVTTRYLPSSFRIDDSKVKCIQIEDLDDKGVAEILTRFGALPERGQDWKVMTSGCLGSPLLAKHLATVIKREDPALLTSFLSLMARKAVDFQEAKEVLPKRELTTSLAEHQIVRQEATMLLLRNVPDLLSGDQVAILCMMAAVGVSVSPGALAGMVGDWDFGSWTKELGRQRNISDRVIRYTEVLAGIPEYLAKNQARESEEPYYSLHPLAAASLRSRAEEDMPREWRKLHRRVFQYHQFSVPLNIRRGFRLYEVDHIRTIYQSIRHGVESGYPALTGWIYGWRCLHGFRAYSTNHLHMLYLDHEALQWYFTPDGKHLRSDVSLNRYNKTQALLWFGALSMSIGKFDSGVEILKLAMKEATAGGNHSTSARAGRFLANSYALRGELDAGLEVAARTVKAARQHDRFTLWLLHRLFSISSSFQTMASLAFQGRILHMKGNLEKAAIAFQEGENIQTRCYPRYPRLRSLWGFFYIQLLLAQGQHQEALDRALAGQVAPDLPSGWGEGVFGLPLMKLAEVQAKLCLKNCQLQDPVKLRQSFAEAWDDFRGIKHGTYNRQLVWLEPFFDLADIDLLILSSDFGSAAANARSLLQKCEELGYRLSEIESLLRLVELVSDKPQAKMYLARARKVAKACGTELHAQEFARLELLLPQSAT